ncbi:hypothetical protein DRJ17_02945 [Candidatus Woesearchaeota archaeon]|nr:MAG: hypothetical protein DRJ17_02945 [Candidatus Woesearchaeota archaeon]
MKKGAAIFKIKSFVSKTKNYGGDSMDIFDEEKRVFLAKKDKSKKGSIDSGILNLVSLINSQQDYYSTSSCSGRIVLIEREEAKEKDKAKWLFSSHDPVNKSLFLKKLYEINLPEKTVWLRQEPLILHIRCRTLQSAFNLLNDVRKLGLKRSGVIAANKRVTIEIIGTERMDVPIAENRKFLIDENYLLYLIEKANAKLLLTKEKIKMLEKIF